MADDLTADPARVQLRRLKGWRMPEGTMKVDRSTRFGNLFPCSKPFGCPRTAGYDRGYRDDGAPEVTCCTDTFREWVRQGQAGEESHLIGQGGGLTAALLAMSGNERRARLVEALPALRGRHLACWCKPEEPCHVDVLLELANA